MAKADRKLAELPEQGASDIEYRDWLTVAVGCPPGVVFGDFVRLGDQLADPCTFTLHAGGDVMEFRTLQKLLAQPATIRATLVYATNGLLRPGHVSRGEFEDIWVALLTLSNIVDTQAVSDETWSWLTQFERVCDVIEGLSFAGPQRRHDALVSLYRRPNWGKVQAGEGKLAEHGSRPVWAIDEQTREQYVRVSELMTFLRHGISVGSIAGSTVNARIREIGGERVRFESRSRVDRGLYPRLTLYLLPAAEPSR